MSPSRGIRGFWLVPALLLGSLAAAGEGTPYLAHRDFLPRMREVRAVGIVKPRMRVFELEADGNRTRKPDWGERADAAIAQGLVQALTARGLEARLIEPTPETAQELEDVALLFANVSRGATFAKAHGFSATAGRFQYSVGDLASLLDRHHVDAIVLAGGSANISSGGRTTLQVLAGLVGGPVSVGVDTLYVGIAARNGDLLWLDGQASTEHDVRDPKSAARFVAEVIAELPEARP
ncbi:MAG TPA: hypothetical protein VMT17_10395 [Anaeromyxobacteraceae bacterium]|nr:hypothetical protein [Anaeromyxobacteraceae bacterium]